MAILMERVRVVTPDSSEIPSEGNGQRPRVAVIVPAFNEEASIVRALTALRQVQQRSCDWEWLNVVINDGSTDGTLATLRSLQQTYPLTILDIPINVGIGAAVQTGFIFALEWGADVTLQFDGDGQHPAEVIPDLVDYILSGRSEVVVGSRYLAGASGAVSHVFRQIGTWLFSQLLRLLVRAKIKDVTSGFRAFNREALRFISEFYADDYPEVETYVPLIRGGFQVEEIPVVMRPRADGTSSISHMGSTYYMFKVTLAVLIQLIKPIHRRSGEGSCADPQEEFPYREP